MSYTPIDEGEVGVKLRWGQAVDTLQPGFNIVIPFMESVVILPTRTQKYTFDEPLNTYSKDIQAADNKVSVNYSVDGTKAIEVYSRYGPDFLAHDHHADRQQALQGSLRQVRGGRDRQPAPEARRRNRRTACARTCRTSIIIEGVQIENIQFSKTYEEAREEAASAEAAVNKARQQLEQKKVDAERVVVQATADATARVTAAKAEADAIRLRGEAEAAALQGEGRSRCATTRATSR